MTNINEMVRRQYQLLHHSQLHTIFFREALSSNFGLRTDNKNLSPAKASKALFDYLMHKSLKNKSNFKELKVLILGCGRGREAELLINLGFSPENIHCVDLTTIGQKFIKNLSCKFHEIAAEDIGKSFEKDFFDIVISTEMLQHTKREVVLKETHKVLMRGGVFVGTDILMSPSAVSILIQSADTIVKELFGTRLLQNVPEGNLQMTKNCYNKMLYNIFCYSEVEDKLKETWGAHFKTALPFVLKHKAFRYAISMCVWNFLFKNYVLIFARK